MKVQASLVALTLMLGTVFGPPARAADAIVIKFSHVVAPNTPKGKAADYFKKLAEERTKGRVKVEVYPNSQLYKDREEIEALQLGAVQMLAPSLSKFGPLGVRAFELFDLPYIFPNKETLYRVMDGEIGKKLFKLLEPKGIIGLEYWDNGFKHMSANRPLRKVEDFKGLKMRIQSSKVLEAQMKALGANPQVMAFSEVYSALQQGVVDGTENPISNLYTQKMHEVQKHLTLSQHGYLGYAVIVNKNFWNGLPDDLRKTLEKAMQDATRYEREIAQKENDDALAAVRKAGTTEVYLLPLQERLNWWKVLLPVHREFEDKIGRDLIQAAYRVAADVEREGKDK
ncbi:MAG TPA: TRAP transporter substrate-binding protein [Thiobacillaceae bacterium]|nr:TRAP transporter substrate-binding protein [Thiobacillaceae bacterium]HNU64209.1 TRAP transporter substrate-binding protein [Thiobacillaceae bacterium]